MKFALIFLLLYTNNALSIERFNADELKHACQITHMRLCSKTQYTFPSGHYQYAIHDGNESEICRKNILQSIVYNEMKHFDTIPPSVKNIASFTISSLLQDMFFITLQDNTFHSEGFGHEGIQWFFTSKTNVIDFCKEVYKDYNSKMIKGFINNVLEMLHNLKNDNSPISMIFNNKDELTIKLKTAL